MTADPRLAAPTAAPLPSTAAFDRYERLALLLRQVVRDAADEWHVPAADLAEAGAADLHAWADELAAAARAGASALAWMAYAAKRRA
ncbi:MAG: hypothetical protein LGL72_01230 [Acidibrevibacterium sp.]|jgi:hypothetical protein|uniref:hypothetical protein n=1 Tax=Acidibrevibacterium fodinaquatile TaxID=1969806 RepID=UPI0023A835CC|nr:hypothetical protein [Acidibrevibacterium fodinaquatile]MCA7118050.1 hypothetical protein [Acidibrevibacterium fodinaquatile]